jgi:DNA mismatch repair ATPase MutS
MRRYDAEVGDVPSQYHDLVKEILRSLEEDVLANEVDLNSLSAAVSEVDATIALSRVAVEYDFVRPKVLSSRLYYPLSCMRA